MTAATDAIVSLDDVPRLVADLEADGEGSKQAARSLLELRTTDAVEPLLRFIVRYAAEGKLPDDPSFVMDFVQRLRPARARVVEPALALLETSGPAWVILLELLACSGVKDDRIFEALVRDIDVSPVLLASMLATYGDERALPAIEDRIVRAITEEDDVAQARELIKSYEALGGALPKKLRAQLDEYEGLKARLEAPTAAPYRREMKIGRNDPCHCGSTKKYKKCCLAKDEGRVA